MRLVLFGSLGKDISFAMFYGKAKHSVDAKGRIILPSKFRDGLGESFLVMRGFEKCLFVYSKEGYKELEEKLRALPISSGGRLQRYIFGSTECVTTDKQGRFVIPPDLRKFAELDKDVIITGVSSRLEIWDADAFENYESETVNDTDKLKELLEIFEI